MAYLDNTGTAYFWGKVKGLNISTFTNDAGYLTSHQDISGKADKATTLGGYGITDAKIENGIITLGSNIITPLTSHSNSYGKVNITMEASGGGGSSTYVDASESNNSNFPTLKFSESFPASYNVGTRTLTFDGTKINNKLDKNTADGLASCSGNGSNNYYKIATIKITSTYINRPILFEISNRGRRFCWLCLEFKSVNSTDPDVAFLETNEPEREFWIKKIATGQWEIYGKYSEAWGVACLHRVSGCGADIGVTVNMTNAGTTEPSGATRATYGTYCKYADSAGSVAWSNVSGKPEIAKVAKQTWGTSTSVTCQGVHCIIIFDKYFGILWIAGTNDININYVHTDGKSYNAGGTGSVTWLNGKYKATRSGQTITVTSTSNASITLLGL